MPPEIVVSSPASAPPAHAARLAVVVLLFTTGAGPRLIPTSLPTRQHAFPPSPPYSGPSTSLAWVPSK